MLRGLALTAGLLFFRSAGAARSDESKNICLPNNETFNFPVCKNTYDSTCSLGDSFLNKFPTLDFDAYQKAGEKIMNARKTTAQASQDLANIVFGKLNAQRHKIFKDMPDATFLKWQKYLALLIDASVKTQLHNQGLGACGEAAKAGIVNSVLKQLTTHTRETIQLINVAGDPLTFVSTKVDMTPGHIFAIFNSQPIAAKKLQGSEELATLMKNLKPQDAMKPVVACDSWVDYQGEADNWLEHLQKGNDHYYGSVNWRNIKVEGDYTIPSMRQGGMTSKQRDFLTELMCNDILRPGLRKVEKMKFKGQNNKKAAVRKRQAGMGM